MALLGAIQAFGPARILAAQAIGPEVPQAGTRVRLVLEPPLTAYKAGAEPVPDLLVARLVRIDTGGIVVRRHVATHVLVDSVGTVTTRRDSTEVRFPTTRVRRVEVSGAGRCSGLARRARCMAIGAALGAATGLAIGQLSEAALRPANEVCSGAVTHRECKTDGKARRRVLGIGFTVGTGLGLLIGKERWLTIAAWPPSKTP